MPARDASSFASTSYGGMGCADGIGFTKPPKSISSSVSSPSESKALLILPGLRLLPSPPTPARPPPIWSADWPALARFCFFHSSKERKFALSNGDSPSVSEALCGVASGASDASVVAEASGTIAELCDEFSCLLRVLVWLRGICELGFRVMASAVTFTISGSVGHGSPVA